MHAINWGIQVKKKGLLMRKKGHLAKSKIYGNHEKKRLVSLSLGIDFNLIVSHLL